MKTMFSWSLVVISIMFHATTVWGYTEGFSNNFFGDAAGGAITTGSDNTFIGGNAGGHNDAGSDNTFIGYDAGVWNSGGVSNTCVGSYAGVWNDTGNYNTFVGYDAGVRASGNYNTLMGSLAGAWAGSNNTSIGSNSGGSTTPINGNVFLGYGAGHSETGDNMLYIDNCLSGGSCTQPFIKGDFSAHTLNINGSLTSAGIISSTSGGVKFPDATIQTTAITGVSSGTITSMGSSTGLSGSGGTFVGVSAGHSNSGVNNTFVGGQSGASNVGGSENSFFGYNAGTLNTGGNRNSFMGIYAGYSNRTGTGNVAVGYEAGNTNQSGNNNTSIGAQAGNNNTGSGNVFIGYQAGYTENSDNKLYIDNCQAGGSGVCNQPLIYGEFDNRLVRINGQLVFTSDERMKKNIEPLKASLDKVMNLKGVGYEWNDDSGFSKGKQIGLIAQDVESIIPEVVFTDSKGYKSLAYDKLVPVLVEAIKEQQKEMQEKDRQYETLLKDRDARIERLEKALEKIQQRIACLEHLSNTVAIK